MAGTLYHVYCDESSQTQSRYMAFGGVIIKDEDRLPFDVALQVWRNETNMHAELKWTKVSNQKEAEYRSLVDLFFKLSVRRDLLHFKCAVFDTWRIDYRRFYGGNKELGFYTFFYFFLLHKFARYACSDADRLIIHLDERTTRYKLGDLQKILNMGIRKHHRRKPNIVRHVEAVSSRQCGIMQIVDVLTGAVSFHSNQLHLRPETRPAKIVLAQHIATSAGVASLESSTWNRPHFDLWRFKLK